MKTKNYTIASLFLVLFFGIIGLTSCEKEEVEKVKVVETDPVVVIDEDTTNYDYPDSIPDVLIDHKRKIITSNWIVQNNEISSREDIDFFDEKFGVVCGVNGVDITQDGGENWKFQPMERNFISFKVQTISSTDFYVNPNRIYRGNTAEDGYFLSVRSDSLKRPVTDFHFVNPAHVIAILDPISGADKGKVYITHNGGLSWIEKREIIGRKLQFINSKIGYMSSYDISQFNIRPSKNIYKTLDSGNNWERINTDVPVHAFYFIDKKTGFFDNNGILYKTTDGGAVWRIISKTLKNYRINDILFTSKNVGYIASHDGVIFRTNDGGFTWIVDHYSAQSRRNTGYQDYIYSALAKTPNNTVYVTGSVTMKRVE